MGDILKTDISFLDTTGSYMVSTFIKKFYQLQAHLPDSGLLSQGYCDPNPGDSGIQRQDSRDDEKTEGLPSWALAINN